MAIQAIVENGKVVSTGSNTTNTSSKVGKQADGGVNEDMFLQLLVAEMKYQDPLEPTSNTEWVSQYATFTQIEQGSDMQDSIKQMEASQLVGKQVIMKTTNSITGETNYFSGMVDYMYVEAGEIYLSVNNNLYNIKDLDTVVDPEYMDAVTCASTFKNMMEKMPPLKAATLADIKLVEAAREAYDSMTDYQKTFVDKDLLKQLEELEERMKKLKAERDENNAEDDEKIDAEEGSNEVEETEEPTNPGVVPEEEEEAGDEEPGDEEPGDEGDEDGGR